MEPRFVYIPYYTYHAEDCQPANPGGLAENPAGSGLVLVPTLRLATREHYFAERVSGIEAITSLHTIAIDKTQATFDTLLAQNVFGQML